MNCLIGFGQSGYKHKIVKFYNAEYKIVFKDGSVKMVTGVIEEERMYDYNRVPTIWNRYHLFYSDEYVYPNQTRYIELIGKNGNVIGKPNSDSTCWLFNAIQGRISTYSAQPLLQGSKVKILESKDGWYKVDATIEGWVSSKYVK